MLIQLRSVNKSYNKNRPNQVDALRGVSMSINEGDLCAVSGPSGSGKSTLLKILGCLDKPTSGEYCLDGENVGTFSDSKISALRNGRIGFILQDFGLIDDSSVFENVSIPLYFSKTKKRNFGQLRLKR